MRHSHAKVLRAHSQKGATPNSVERLIRAPNYGLGPLTFAAKPSFRFGIWSTAPWHRSRHPPLPASSGLSLVVPVNELNLESNDEFCKARHPGHRDRGDPDCGKRSEEHTSELQALMRISDAGLCLTKKNIRLSKRD